MEYENITRSVISIAKEVGFWLRDQAGKLDSGMIQEKGQMDFVTLVDQESEKRLVKELSILLPDAGFIAEEGTQSHRGERFNWVIDPIDGTTNFIHGVFPFSISIALLEENEIVSGVILDPLYGECFYAWKDGPAFLNDTRIHVSSRMTLSESLLATGFPYNDFTLINPYLDSLRDLMSKTHGIRRLGSAAIDLAYVACGRYDGFWEYHLKPWDVAAGTLIIRRAGGIVNDFHGGDDFLFGETYVATNGNIHREFLELLSHHFSANR